MATLPSWQTLVRGLRTSYTLDTLDTLDTWTGRIELVLQPAQVSSRSSRTRGCSPAGGARCASFPWCPALLIRRQSYLYSCTHPDKQQHGTVAVVQHGIRLTQAGCPSAAGWVLFRVCACIRSSGGLDILHNIDSIL